MKKQTKCRFDMDNGNDKILNNHGDIRNVQKG